MRPAKSPAKIDIVAHGSAARQRRTLLDILCLGVPSRRFHFTDELKVGNLKSKNRGKLGRRPQLTLEVIKVNTKMPRQYRFGKAQDQMFKSVETCRVLATLLILVTPLVAQQLAIIEHPVTPITDSDPYAITQGPDQAMWFTLANFGQIGRIDSRGAISLYIIPAYDPFPAGITTGPDGALWFAESTANSIGRITTSGIITEYLIPTSDCEPQGITSGPDGDLWFTETVSGKIGRITTAGVITEYSLPLSGSGPWDITTGSDGALWFTESGISQIGRITTSGAITEFPVPTPNSQCYGIAAGSDGAIWFTESGAAKIGRVTVLGDFTEFPLAAGSYPFGITGQAAGPLWFTELDTNQIARITTAGVISEFAVPSAQALPDSITAGSAGDLWFTESGGNIGQIVIATASLTPNPASAPPGMMLTLSGSGFSAGEIVDLQINHVGGPPVNTVIADSSGSFVSTGTVHDAPFGTESLVAKGESSGKLAVAHLGITSRIVTNPDAGTPGTTVVAQGYGFSDGDYVQMVWNIPKVQLGRAIASETGTFSFTFKIPDGAQPGLNLVFGKGIFGPEIGKGYITVQ